MKADATDREPSHYELLMLIERYTPEDKSSPYSTYLPGFTSLRLLLQKQARSDRDSELLKTILVCYNSYKKTGRPDEEIATMTARDFMFLSKQNSTQVNSRNYSAGLSQTSNAMQQQQHHDVNTAAASTNGALVGSASLSLSQQQQQDQRQQPVPTLAKNVFGEPIPDTNLASNNGGIAQSMLQASMPSLAPQLNGEFASQLQQLIGTTMASAQDQLHSLGTSPALQPITSQPDGAAVLAPLGLTASQLQALLQNDATVNFQGSF